MLAEHLLDQAADLASRIVALRRAIHAEPELGLETPLTLAKVRAELAGLPLEWREGSACTEDELRAFCVGRLGAYKAPKAIRFVADLPRGPSGKVQRLKLLELPAG